MAEIVWRAGEVSKKIALRIENALTVVGALGVSFASDRLRANGSVVTSNLINSLTYSTDKVQGPMPGGATDGSQLTLAVTRFSVKIGSVVVYAARVEFGFTGRDSLGRYYNQAPKSYLRAGLTMNKAQILKVFDMSKAA